MSDSVSKLCLACGLCCDGTLFTHVTLSQAEAEALRQRDLALEPRANGTFRLRQRCGALDGRCCTAYAERPASCRAYICLLAKALEEGELTLPEALETVASAHTRLAELRAELPTSDVQGSPVPAVRRSLQGEGAALTDRAAAAWDAARAYLRRHFTGRHGLS